MAGGLLDRFRKKPRLLPCLLGIGIEPGMKSEATGKDMAKKAVKCDMCRDLSGGPACVRACPTSAAFRVGPERFLDFSLPNCDD